jgi:hypothetical protein
MINGGDGFRVAVEPLPNLQNQYGQGPLPMTGNEVVLASQSYTNGAQLSNYTALQIAALFGASVTIKPVVTGSRGGNAALASLLTALAGLGLITDSTT